MSTTHCVQLNTEFTLNFGAGCNLIQSVYSEKLKEARCVPKRLLLFFCHTVFDTVFLKLSLSKGSL